MSTATQTKIGFNTPDAEKLPKIACVGVVEEFGEGKLTQSQQYLIHQIRVKGNGANRNTRTNFMYRPDWLTQDFQPNSLKELTETGPLFVYQKNIIGPKGSNKLSALQGLAGTEERFVEVSTRLLAIQAGGLLEAEDLASQVQAVLHQFLLVEGEDVLIGYEMQQKTEDTGERDEKGKKIKVLVDGYELGSYFYPTEKNLKAKRVYAERSPDKMKIAFDDETAF